MSTNPAGAVVVELLGKHHDRTGFSCGAPDLDRYLRRQAGQDQRRRDAIPYVLIDRESGAVVGYYTLSAYGTKLVDLPEEVVKKLPRHPIVPATLLGRLAVDTNFHGKGYGELLLLDALRRALQAAARVGSVAVVVEARDETAEAFYPHFGFLPFADHARRLFLPMATISALY